MPPAALRPGTEVRDIRPDGTVVHAGGTLTGDLVVGADGLRSVTHAAHAMTPNVGQGACQALEDAVVLAAEVAERGTAAGLRAYDLARRPRTQMVVRRSRGIGPVAHWTAPPLVALRDTVMRMMPYASLVRSFRPLVDWPAASGAERPAVGTGAPPPAGSLRDH
ncbi:hypothetical protein C1I98_06675 [Spongiactinospora gelatinilytica]|uniref:FAD-binding domain-containing protein n=1 Tax=Spongiactinospora gelatinilytica TaxID=2666298 RepID=A0A2W2GYW3_9ACTN|nr:hypothetical protein [Spongiactinospora gelatinilytica]PZG52853.1 hypothetical protein C1I98_06675 [Spongiactinospora gelatinilytica]